MIARLLNNFYMVVGETEETVTIAWHQTTKYRTHSTGRIDKMVWFKPGCGEDFERVEGLIGVDDDGTVWSD